MQLVDKRDLNFLSVTGINEFRYSKKIWKQQNRCLSWGQYANTSKHWVGDKNGRRWSKERAV